MRPGEPSDAAGHSATRQAQPGPRAGSVTPASASASGLSGQEASAGFVAHEPGSGAGTPQPSPAVSTPKGAEAAPARQGDPNDITRAVIATSAQAPGAAAHPVAAPAAPAQALHTDPSAAPEPRAPTGQTGAPLSAGPATAPVAIASAVAAPAPDAVTQALHLRPAPMSSADEVRVLELVTQIATIVRDLKEQDANLRSDFARTSADDRARLDDFARRIDFADASKAVTAAGTAGDRGTGPAPQGAAGPTVRPVLAVAPIAVTRAEAALPPAAPVQTKHYRVQAASPGLALLTELDRGGGDGAQIQVTVGDTIPGWGKVKSVAHAERRGL